MFIFSAARNVDIAVLSAKDILGCHTIGYGAGVGLISINIAESGIAGSCAVEGDFGVAGHGAVESGSTVDGDPLVGAEGFDIVAEQIMIAVDGQITIGSAVDSGSCAVSELGTIGGIDITVIAFFCVGIGGAAEGDRSCFSRIQDSGKSHSSGSRNDIGNSIFTCKDQLTIIDAAENISGIIVGNGEGTDGSDLCVATGSIVEGDTSCTLDPVVDGQFI